jgi:putative colanic acid biosynthesis acetyltransferase WcaF
MTMSATDPAMSQSDSFDLRRRPSFDRRHRMIRLLWIIVWTLLFRWTPKQMRVWRVFLLRRFGATIGYHSDVRGSVRVFYPANLTMGKHSVLADGIDCYNMAPLTIGDFTIVSQRVYLCGGTHDYTIASHPLMVRPVTIGSNVWVAAEAMIAPGCIVPDGCLIGARAMVYGELEPWSIYSGNPGRRIKTRTFDPSR